LLWDHLATLPDEVRLIWPSRWEYSKIAFLYNRYAVEAYLLYVAYALSGISGGITDKFCKAYVIFISLFAFVSMAMANLLILFRVYTLYDHRRQVMVLMVFGFCVSYAAILGFGVVVIQGLFHNISADEKLLRTCIVAEKPIALVGVWASMVGFDIYAFTLTFWNAAERPRHVQIELISILKRDGITFFFALFCMRLLNLIISIVAGPDLMFLGVYFVQAIVSLTLSRLLLQVENMRTRIGQVPYMTRGEFESYEL